MKKALIFGSSGFIGSYLLQELLGSPDYEQVTAVVRNPLGVSHPKLKTLFGGHDSLPELKPEIAVDDAFIAIGTTKKKTPDQRDYYRIDHDYPVLAARIARERGAASVFLVSAIGANPDSKVFYVRTKGEAERDIIALGYDHTHIFRPSVIMGDRPEQRTMEKALIAAFRVLNPLLVGPLRNCRGMEAKNIAKAMCVAASRPAGTLNVYAWEDMETLLRSQTAD